MKYLINRNGIICILLMILIQANAQSGAPFRMRPSTSIQKITIDSLFQTSDTLDIFNNTTNVATDLMQAVNNLNDTAKYSINPSINSNGYIYHFDITSSN